MAVLSNRLLLRRLTARKIEIRYKGSVLGYLWMVLDPLVMLGIYLFVFGYIFGGSFTGSESESKAVYALTIFIGLSFYRLFSEIMAISSQSVISNTNYVKKVVFPLEILPAIDVFKALFSFVVSLGLIVLSTLLLGIEVGLSSLWWFYLIFIFMILSLGVSWGLSSITVYLRDLGNVIQFVSIGLLFGSAIFYPIAQIPETAWSFLKYNPILQFVQIAREITVWNESPDLIVLSVLGLFSVFSFYIGYAIFSHLRKGFADVL